jgi:UDP-2-acetamido-2-deoxy-ribo-hexuluronate aminotransferase
VKKNSLPFIDLARQQAEILPELEHRISQVLQHGRYIMGPEVGELEQALAEFTGNKHAIGCSSGTDALLMALMAKGVGPGDAIITTPFTFVATAEVISLVGATPVFVDIDPLFFNMVPEKLEQAIKAMLENDRGGFPLPQKNESIAEQTGLRPKGIIAVDLFGLPADYDRINAIAEKYDLFVIEDAAQSFGATYKGKRACSLAELGCTSFFPAKPLGCYGDGGAVFTNSDDMAERLKSVRVHGQGSDKYDNIRVGLNARIDTLQAAILLPKLKIFPEEIQARNRVASTYNQMLADFGSGLQIPSVPERYESVWAQYSVLADNAAIRERIQATLKEEGIPTAIYYPIPLHLQTAYAGFGYEKGDFPVSEEMAERIFSLPMHPYLEAKEIERICRTISNYKGER